MAGNNRMRPVRSRDDIIEKAKQRRRKPAKLWDMTGVMDGVRKREPPEYCRRADGMHLFYHGKENAIYGETEAGKDMLLAETVAQSLDWGVSVSWIDFEEGTEIDVGERLKEMGVDRDTVCDIDMFRFSTPEDVDSAQDSMYDALTHRCGIVIFNGIQSAYGLFGWDPFDPISPAMFRRQLVAPLLTNDHTVIETDHMTKSSVEGRSNGSRYAAGGLSKLNWLDGAAYLLEAVDPIVRGGVGKSRLILTKDRPGSIKPTCTRLDKEPRMMYAGMLVVKSVGDEHDGYDLMVEVTAPAPGSVVASRKPEKQSVGKYVPDDVIDKVIGLYRKLGRNGASKNQIESMYRGDGARYVRAAIDIALLHGCIAIAGKSSSSNMAPLRYVKDWDPKQRISNDEE
jgi:hypothetical protein